MKITDKGRWYMLSEYQRVLVELLAQGMNVKEIAFKLRRSKKTIDWNRWRIYQKTGYKTPLDLCRFAIRLGLIQP